MTTYSSDEVEGGKRPQPALHATYKIGRRPGLIYVVSPPTGPQQARWLDDGDGDLDGANPPFPPSLLAGLVVDGVEVIAKDGPPDLTPAARAAGWWARVDGGIEPPQSVYDDVRPVAGVVDDSANSWADVVGEPWKLPSYTPTASGDALAAARRFQRDRAAEVSLELGFDAETMRCTVDGKPVGAPVGSSAKDLRRMTRPERVRAWRGKSIGGKLVCHTSGAEVQLSQFFWDRGCRFDLDGQLLGSTGEVIRLDQADGTTPGDLSPGARAAAEPPLDPRPGDNPHLPADYAARIDAAYGWRPDGNGGLIRDGIGGTIAARIMSDAEADALLARVDASIEEQARLSYRPAFTTAGIARRYREEDEGAAPPPQEISAWRYIAYFGAAIVAGILGSMVVHWVISQLPALS